MLHAWKAVEQTTRLARELAGMSDGGVFVLTVPPVAYRCPPGPYERISQVAWFLKNKKPKSKLSKDSQEALSKAGSATRQKANRLAKELASALGE